MRFSIRPEDRRSWIVGFVGLMTIMMAHSVMETARDTLFLTRLPATDLPRAYLAIALVAIVVLQLHERLLSCVRDRRRLLAASLFFGSSITLGFWSLLDDLGGWAPFGFYVWTGLLITVVLIEFWLLLGDAVTVTQAKRIFPAIAAGGVTGATLGSLLAEGVLRVASAGMLVLTAAGILALAAATAFLWRVRATGRVDETVTEHAPSLRWLLGNRYMSRVLSLVLLGTMALTMVDFVFKSTVSESIPAVSLGPFFARFYLGLNSVALLVHMAGAGWLLRGFGTHRGSSLLPGLMFGGALGLALGPLLPFAVVLKAVDGSLRHTLYRSSVEVLYLPLESRERERAKGMIEVFGHRIGQALASLLIIGAVMVGLSTRELGLALALVAAGWLGAVLSTRRPYVEQFRARLRRGLFEPQRGPEPWGRDAVESDLTSALMLHLERVVQLLEQRAAIEAEAAREATDAEPLRLALRDQEQATLERAFWLMGRRHPDEDFELVWRGLQSDSPCLRAASIEILEAVLPGSVREAVLAVVDDAEPAVRARAAAAALRA